MGHLGYGAYPTHPGEVLKDEIEERGITQRQLADSMGLTYSVVNEILNARRPLTAKTALMFEAAFNEQTAVARFPELLPENVRSHIQKVRAANGVLFVSCDNAALRFELTNRRSELLAQLNEGFAEVVISDIVVR